MVLLQCLRTVQILWKYRTNQLVLFVVTYHCLSWHYLCITIRLILHYLHTKCVYYPMRYVHKIFSSRYSQRRHLSRAAFLLIEGVALLTVSSRFRSDWTSVAGPTIVYLVQLFYVAHILLLEFARHRTHILTLLDFYIISRIVYIMPRKITNFPKMSKSWHATQDDYHYRSIGFLSMKKSKRILGRSDPRSQSLAVSVRVTTSRGQQSRTARDGDDPLVRSTGDATRRRGGAAVPRQGAHLRRADRADVSQSSLVGP